MVIKTAPQILKRVSIRWLPDEAYENTDTVALNVGGYFMDLRVNIADQSLEWARSGKREVEPGKGPATFQWSRIVDSLGSTQTDEASFRVLPNGDDLEFGKFNKDGTLIPYEEVWQDVTDAIAAGGSSWIVQSKKSSACAFYGKVGHIFLAMHQDEQGRFGVRREDYDLSAGGWMTTFEGGPRVGPDLERAPAMVSELDNMKWSNLEVEGTKFRGTRGLLADYVIFGYSSPATRV